MLRHCGGCAHSVTEWTVYPGCRIGVFFIACFSKSFCQCFATLSCTALQHRARLASGSTIFAFVIYATYVMYYNQTVLPAQALPGPCGMAIHMSGAKWADCLAGRGRGMDSRKCLFVCHDQMVQRMCPYRCFLDGATSLWLSPL